MLASNGRRVAKDFLVHGGIHRIEKYFFLSVFCFFIIRLWLLGLGKPAQFLSSRGVVCGVMDFVSFYSDVSDTTHGHCTVGRGLIIMTSIYDLSVYIPRKTFLLSSFLVLTKRIKAFPLTSYILCLERNIHLIL